MTQMILEGFEKFTKRGRSFRPKLTIRVRGQMAFNNGAVHKFNLDKYNYVVLYMSSDKNKIAIQLTNDQNEEGIIKLVKKPGNYCFSGRSFLDFYGIDYSKSEHYDIEQHEAGALVANLRQRDVK